MCVGVWGEDECMGVYGCMVHDYVYGCFYGCMSFMCGFMCVWTPGSYRLCQHPSPHHDTSPLREGGTVGGERGEGGEGS